MILQTDPQFGDKENWIHKYGCLYLCCLFILNQKKGLRVSIAKIKIYLEQLKEANAFNKDMDLLWIEFFKFFGEDISIKFESPTYKLKKGELSIMKYFNEKTDLSHFVVGVGNVVCYDPMGDSKTVSQGKPIESRIIKFK